MFVNFRCKDVLYLQEEAKKRENRWKEDEQKEDIKRKRSHFRRTTWKNIWQNNWKAKKRPKNIKHAVFFDGVFFFSKKKSEEFKACEKDVLPNYYFASLLRREFLTLRRTIKKGTEFSVKKRNKYKRKHVFFTLLFCEEGRVRKRKISKKKKTEFVVEKKGKTIRKNGWDFSRRSSFFSKKKLKRPKKKQEMRKAKKKGPKQQSQPEGRSRNKKNVHQKKEQQNNENKVKNGEKGDEKKKRREKNPRRRHKQERESRREKKKNGWKKGYTKEVCKKEAREIFKNAKKTRMNTFLRKQRKLSFFAHEKVLALDKAEKNISCLSKKERKVDQKNTFFFRKGLSKEHVFFLFSFFWCIFLCTKKKLKKRNKAADETCENWKKKRESFWKKYVMFLLKTHFFLRKR